MPASSLQRASSSSTAGGSGLAAKATSGVSTGVSGAGVSGAAVTGVATGPGNAAVAAKVSAAAPTWTKTESESVQRELLRLGLYASKIDGDIGPGSKAALVEAFGGDEWRAMVATDVVTRLKAATPPANAGGIRYGEMFKDGVLDITLGIGFDETNAHLSEISAIAAALDSRGYEEDTVEALTLLGSTGRKGGGGGRMFVKRDAIHYKPPAGGERSVHAVVRFVSTQDGSKGAESAQAMSEGLQSSDVTMYGGHGRYGSGPDFDRNMRFELLGADTSVEREIDDYTVLEKVLEEEGKSARLSAWQVFEKRVAAGTLKVIGTNEGNVYLNTANNHPGEFGGKLMFWNLQHSDKKPQTGAKGGLAQAGSEAEKKYRLWVFDGCRTQDYVKSIRDTPGASSRDVGVMASQRTLYWNDIGETLVSFLDGVVGQQSPAKITEGMDSKQAEGAGAFKFR